MDRQKYWTTIISTIIGASSIGSYFGWASGLIAGLVGGIIGFLAAEKIKKDDRQNYIAKLFEFHIKRSKKPVQRKFLRDSKLIKKSIS